MKNLKNGLQLAKASFFGMFLLHHLRVSGLMLPCAGGHQDEQQLGRWDMMGSGQQRSAWNIIELNEELSLELSFAMLVMFDYQKVGIIHSNDNDILQC